MLASQLQNAFAGLGDSLSGKFDDDATEKINAMAKNGLKSLGLDNISDMSDLNGVMSNIKEVFIEMQNCLCFICD